MNHSSFLLTEEELETVSPQYRFENGKAVDVGKEIVLYKLGTEYASGGAGGCSSVDDYIKFLEGLRTYRLLKAETIQMMTRDRLVEEQKEAYWVKGSHGYGLGVRCPKGDPKYIDFGWGGAAGAFLAIDIQNEISLYFATHLLSSPAQGLRSLLYRFVRAEMIDSSEFEGLQEELDDLYDYHLTY